MRKIRVGIIGCGVISRKYAKSIIEDCDNLEIVSCADLYVEAAQKLAEEFDIRKAYSVEEILGDPDVEMIINLTIPAAHAEISLKALDAGKHVYVEKPLALELEDGAKIIEKANEKGLLIGCAPDTFLGAGLETCKRIIDDGLIGKPAVAIGHIISGGPEDWHPNPDFFYKNGAGPLFDVGPYYITALVTILGPVTRVCGSAKITYPERTITSQPRYGDKIVVEAPTNVISILEFECGASATVITSFDACDYTPGLKMYGSKGTLIFSDPNTFDGPVLLKEKGTEEFREMPLVSDKTGERRGIGASDMANTIINGGTHKANGAMAFHVLEIMHGIQESSEKGIYCNIKSTF